MLVPMLKIRSAKATAPAQLLRPLADLARRYFEAFPPEAKA
jgi:hypothetical protein